MKAQSCVFVENIQIIDGAGNCAYDIFAATDEEFSIIFPLGQNVAFIEKFISREVPTRLEPITATLWTRPIKKREAMGLHGLLFYELEFKKKFTPPAATRTFIGRN